MTKQGCWLMVLRDRRALAYFRCCGHLHLRPDHCHLPLTAAADRPRQLHARQSLSSTAFGKRSGSASLSSAPALMLTACLSLDLARAATS